VAWQILFDVALRLNFVVATAIVCASERFPMFQNLLTGPLMIVLTVLVRTFGLIAVTRVITHATDRFRMHGHRSRVVAMVSVVFGLFLVPTVEIWLWAACYWFLAALSNFGAALYLSTVSFSTVGFGDVASGRMALAWRSGGGERLSDDRLVHRLSHCCFDAGRPVPQRRALLRASVRQKQIAALAV
jgi:Ion channel